MPTLPRDLLHPLTWLLTGVAIGVGTGMPLLVLLGHRLTAAIAREEAWSLMVRELLVRSGFSG